MSTVVVFEHLVVDGVMQSPGRADEIAATASSTAVGDGVGPSHAQGGRGAHGRHVAAAEGGGRTRRSTPTAMSFGGRHTR